MPIVPCKTSSNPVVGSNKGSSANGAKKRVVAEEVVADSESERRAVGGLSEGDDTLEQEAAISSPLKGTDNRGSAKVSS